MQSQEAIGCQSQACAELIWSQPGCLYGKVITTAKEEMQMQITDQARDILKQMFEKENARNIRIYFAGYG
jgi:radical SAM superfamily enzyme